jgi:hypothetical protein
VFDIRPIYSDGTPEGEAIANRLPSLAAMERSGIAVKRKALLDVPSYPTISRATYGTTLKTRKTILNNPRKK